jgi:hypothetical protein
MDKNYLLYGPSPEDIEKKIKEIIGDRNSILWTSTFGRLCFEDFKKVYNKTTKGSKEFFEIENFMDAVKADTGFIIIKNIHTLAHAQENPELFYQGLLGACNFYTNQFKVNFILSCVRVPRVFLNENPFIAQWILNKCETGIDAEDEQRIEILKNKKMYGRQFMLYHYLNLKNILLENFMNAADLANIPGDSRYSEIDRMIRTTIETFTEYESNVYLREEEQENKTIPLKDIDTIKEELEKRIFGQAEAIQRVVNVVLMFYGSRKIDDKPRQIFLFIGPSGVGKTELCSQLRYSLPGYRFLQINLSEHKDEHAVNKLIGVGRGYKGLLYLHDNQYGYY